MSGNNTKDYYYILGIARDASQDEIKKAYRKLSTKFHPDKNDGDKFFEERFKDINEAYETLVDDIKRKNYDARFNESNTAAETPSPPPPKKKPASGIKKIEEPKPPMVPIISESRASKQKI